MTSTPSEGSLSAPTCQRTASGRCRRAWRRTRPTERAAPPPRSEREPTLRAPSTCARAACRCPLHAARMQSERAQAEHVKSNCEGGITSEVESHLVGEDGQQRALLRQSFQLLWNLFLREKPSY